MNTRALVCEANIDGLEQEGPRLKPHSLEPSFPAG